MNSSEIQWKEGIVISERSNIFNFDNDMWDDNEILEVTPYLPYLFFSSLFFLFLLFFF